MKRPLRDLLGSIYSRLDLKLESERAPSSFESLEPRVFLSGNVFASVSNGKLSVQGDAAANFVLLDQTGLTANQVRLSGTSDTAINNQTGPIVLSGITQHVTIRLGSGPDSLSMSNVSLPGNVSLNGQGGANTFTINNVAVGKSLSVQNSSVHSNTTIANATVGKNLSIPSTTGGENVALQSVDVERNTKIISGSAPGILTVDDSTFHGEIAVTTGKGADLIQIESHGDPVGPPTQFAGKVRLSMGSGNDTLQIGLPGQTGNRSTFARQIHFDGGRGSDTLRNFDSSPYIGRVRIRSFEVVDSTSDTTAPVVSAVTPATNESDVALNRKIAATFSQIMDPTTITEANVTVTAPGSIPVSGTVAYSGTTMTFRPASALAPNTTFTATITTGAKNLAGIPLADNFVWNFTTGATADTTAPVVSSVDPATGATNVALNRKIAATFSEAMDPLTITAANVNVTAPGSVLVLGTVAYTGTTMTFTPTIPLAPNTTFTATIGTGTMDLAGNPLAADFIWTFTSGATPDITAPTVTSTSPVDLQTNVLINKPVVGTFSESMDPLTIPANFKVTGPGATLVAGTVNYDGPGQTATFTPSSNFAPNTTFTATITGGVNGVKDLAGNSLASDKVWTFTSGTQIAQAPINLGSAGAFAVMATSAISGTGNHIVGDIGLNPGSSQGIPPSEVTGTIHVDDQAIINAQSALLAAYNDAVSRSTTSVTLPGNMGGLTFTPGLYTNSSSVLIQGAGPANNVTLDAQGDPNAIFIFKMGSTLTTAPGAQVILAGGAKAGNVFWQVGSSATLDTTTIFKGNILAAVTITVNNGAAIEGRLLGGTTAAGSVTVNASTVTVPSA